MISKIEKAHYRFISSVGREPTEIRLTTVDYKVLKRECEKDYKLTGDFDRFMGMDINIDDNIQHGCFYIR